MSDHPVNNGGKRRLIIDTDAHYYENPRAFGKYIDEPWRTRLERWTGLYYAPIAAASRTHDVLVGGRMKRKDLGLPVTDCRDGVLEIMDYLGVDVTVLLPGMLLGIAEISDKRRAVTLCHGFIEHMINETLDPTQGIYTMIVASNQSPEDAGRLIDRYGHHDGVCGVCMMTDAPFLPFGDSYYDPIYDACVRNDLALVLHSGYGGPEGHESGYGLQTYVENHIAFVFNNMRQMTSMIFQGVPERFPSLKIAFQEAGIFWIPQMMWRLDSEYSMRRPEVPWLKKPPSEYIKAMWFGTQPLERVPHEKYLKYCIEMMDGENNLMFATDWPHSDFDSPVVIERMSFLSDAGKSNILGGNAQRLLRFRGKGAPQSGETKAEAAPAVAAKA
jgi:predicted TIM-barrel fold metal-dependent hydrolase